MSREVIVVAGLASVGPTAVVAGAMVVVGRILAAVVVVVVGLGVE